MGGEAFAPIIIAILAVILMMAGVSRRKQKIQSDPVKYHKLAVDYTSKCLERGREIEPEVIKYFLKEANAQWAIDVGYDDASDELREIETAQWKKSDLPRRYELSLPRSLREAFALQASRQGYRSGADG